MSVSHYLAAAENVAERIPNLLSEQGLDPFISRFVLTETEFGDVWFFVVLDDSVIKFPETYGKDEVLESLIQAFHDHLVMFSNFNGLRYAILLSPYRNFLKLPLH